MSSDRALLTQGTGGYRACPPVPSSSYCAQQSRDGARNLESRPIGPGSHIKSSTVRRAAFASLACFALGTLANIVGGRLIVQSLGNSTGSPMGWVLVSAGVIGLLAVLGFSSGVYEA